MEVFALFRKKMKKENGQKVEKQENGLISKESISAVCCLFSLLALLMLFTDTLVFGEIGKIVSDFLLGMFGYLAFPIFMGTAYLSIVTFIEKRLVKNRLAFTLLSVAFVSLLVLTQTAVTYSWASEGYASACFSAGQEYATATLVGWLGSLIISLCSALLTKIGTIVLFGLVSMLTVYFGACSLTGKKAFAFKRKERKPKKVKETDREQAMVQPDCAIQQTPVEIQQTPNRSVYPEMQREGFSESAYSYAAQRPSFSINPNAETGATQNVQNKQGAYSPFGNFSQNQYAGKEEPSVMQNPATSEEYREILFGNTSAEDFRKNLMNVNKRYSDSSNADLSAQTSGNGFNSYTNSYENDLNANVRPQKIIEEITPTPSRDYTTPMRSYATPKTENETFSRNYPEQPPVSRSNDSLGLGNSDRGVNRSFNSRDSFSNDPIRQQPFVSFNTDEPSTDCGISRAEVRRGFDDSFSTLGRDGYLGEDKVESLVVEEPTETVNDTFETPKREEFLNIRESYLDRTDRVAPIEPQEKEEPIAPVRDKSDRLNIFDDDYEPNDETEDDDELPSTSNRAIGFGAWIPDRSLDSARFTAQPVEPIKEVAPTPPPEPPKPPKPKIYRPYSPAPLHYFNCSDVEPDADETEVEQTKDEIIKVYEDYGVNVTIASVTFGPTITRYNIVAPRNIPTSKLVSKDVETSMALSLRVESGVNIYPNFKDGVISIEVPNKQRQTVHLGCMLTGREYMDSKPTSLVFSMGKNVANQKIYGDICKMTHLLVAGSSGSGKSVFLGTLIVSLINRYSPQQLRLILIDPKKTEFVIYHDLPHLMINEIINDPKKAVQSLGWAIGEMNRRYELFEKMSLSGSHVVNIDEYNANLKEGEEKLPKIVIVVDELADLMLAAKKDVEERIQNLTQKSRAAGIHLIIATQRPSADVITGVIKSNLATRIAFMVPTDVDSRVILDASGAQKLLGYGDMMYITAGQKEPIRLQSAFISSSDTQRVVEHIKSHNDAYFDEEATNFINTRGGNLNVADDDSPEAIESIFIDALRMAIHAENVSISMIQRRCGVGFNKAGKIVDWMEAKGYISPMEGAAKPRKVLITKEEFEETYGPL